MCVRMCVNEYVPTPKDDNICSVIPLKKNYVYIVEK